MLGRCVVCGAPAEGDFGTGCRAHVVAAAALHPGRAWRGDVDVEAAGDEGLRGRIEKAARIQSGEEVRSFFQEDVGTDTIVGGKWVVCRVPVPVEKFGKEAGRAPSASEITVMPANLGGGRVVMCSSDGPAFRPRLELFK